MQQPLSRVYAEAREQVGDSFDLTDPGIQDSAHEWAAGYAPVLAGQIVENTRDKTEDGDPNVWLGEERAKRIGVTEVTRANTAGEVGILALLLLFRPDYEGPWWETESEEPCEVCLSLEGEPRRVWAAEFPEGPPGPHPECQCALSWVK
jgi:hypothetical protein